MLTWEYPPRIVGGIARVVHDLSKRLIKDGHEVTVVTYKDGDVPYFEDDGGVQVYRVDNYMISPNNFIDWIMQMNFNLVAKASEIINKQGKFDVIHAHDWLVAYAAKSLKNSQETKEQYANHIENREKQTDYKYKLLVDHSSVEQCADDGGYGYSDHSHNDIGASTVENGVLLGLFSRLEIAFKLFLATHTLDL